MTCKMHICKLNHGLTPVQPQVCRQFVLHVRACVPGLHYQPMD